jgi:hypothetical protein
MPASAGNHKFAHSKGVNMSEQMAKVDVSSFINEARKKAEQEALDAVKFEFDKQQVTLKQVSILLLETGAVKLPLEKIRACLETAVVESKRFVSVKKRGPKPKPSNSNLVALEDALVS